MDDRVTMVLWLWYYKIQCLILSADPKSLPRCSVGHGLGSSSGQPRPWQSLPKLQLVVSVRHWWPGVDTGTSELPWRHPVTNINVSPDFQILSKHPPVRVWNEPAKNWRWWWQKEKSQSQVSQIKIPKKHIPSSLNGLATYISINSLWTDRNCLWCGSYHLNVVLKKCISKSPSHHELVIRQIGIM